VKPEYEQEIAANLERAEKSIQAAKNWQRVALMILRPRVHIMRRFMLQLLHC